MKSRTYQPLEIDDVTLRAYRVSRVRQMLNERDCAAGLFYDPVNIRYVTDVSNMQVYSLHNPCRYVFIATDGPVVLFDFKGCEHLSADIEVVDETRNAVSWYHFVTGPRVAEKATVWADEIDALLTRYGGGNRRLAVDQLDLAGVWAIEKQGVQLVDGKELIGMARVLKSAEEIKAIRNAIAVCELGMQRMQQALQPDRTENHIWSMLHQTNIEHGGEWIETRLLSSGPRTNPWYQECSDRRIERGDFCCARFRLNWPTRLYGRYFTDVACGWETPFGRTAPLVHRCLHAASAQH